MLSIFKVINTFTYVCLCLQVIFQAMTTKPTWSYVIQVAPRSKQIYEEHDLLENSVNQTIDEEQLRVKNTSDMENDQNTQTAQEEEVQDERAIPSNEHEEEDVLHTEENNDEDKDEQIMSMNDDQLFGELDLFIDLFTQQDLLDDDNCCGEIKMHRGSEI